MSNAQNNNEIDMEEKVEILVPRLYNVIFLNDDYTPMDFVMLILKGIFEMDDAKAKKITLKIHKEGKGIVGTYVKAIAEMKVALTLQNANRHGHPLVAIAEPE